MQGSPPKGRDRLFTNKLKAQARFVRRLESIDPTLSDAELRNEVELAEVEYALGWTPKPKDLCRIAGSHRDGTWTVYDRDLNDPDARQIAVYHPDRPGQPDYVSARRWNEGRNRAVAYRRQFEAAGDGPCRTLPSARRQIPVAGVKRSQERSREYRPAVTRRASASSSTSSADPGDGDSDPAPASAYHPLDCPSCGAQLYTDPDGADYCGGCAITWWEGVQ